MNRYAGFALVVIAGLLAAYFISRHDGDEPLAVNPPELVPGMPPEPFEDAGACPFEGCIYREWKVKTAIAVHADRRDDSPIAFRLQAGESVTALTGVVVTLRAGRVRFNSTQRLDTSSGPIEISPEQTLYLLTSLGEGWTKAWFNGKLYEQVDMSRVTTCEGSVSRPCLAQIVEPAQKEWWVQVRSKAGQLGWTRETSEFDGKDAHG